MNARIYLSINLVVMAAILVFLPSSSNKGDELSPGEMLRLASNINDLEVNVDKAAQYISNSNTDIQFIDLRTSEEYLSFNIPGSINIPYDSLLKKDWQGYLNPKDKTNILYSNNGVYSALAVSVLNSRGYRNNKSLKGGLDEWFITIMKSEYKGGRLSARENAILENRRKARILFTEINSLPDSLKNTFLEAKILEEEQLDGGCE